MLRIEPGGDELDWLTEIVSRLIYLNDVPTTAQPVHFGAEACVLDEVPERGHFIVANSDGGEDAHVERTLPD